MGSAEDSWSTDSGEIEGMTASCVEATGSGVGAGVLGGVDGTRWTEAVVGAEVACAGEDAGGVARVTSGRTVEDTVRVVASDTGDTGGCVDTGGSVGSVDTGGSVGRGGVPVACRWITGSWGSRTSRPDPSLGWKAATRRGGRFGRGARTSSGDGAGAATAGNRRTGGSGACGRVGATVGAADPVESGGAGGTAGV